MKSKCENSECREIAIDNLDAELDLILNKLLAPKAQKREVHLVFTNDDICAQCGSRK